jgi:bacillithiol biosynthesis cysteine-adding enzyme BshC
MQSEKISFEETGHFSKLFVDYINSDSSVQPYFAHYPESGNFKTIIQTRNFDISKRSVLVAELQNQYEGLSMSEAVVSNIKKLGAERTFTVTTGHQLNVFTGPLYFVYKIVTVINICKKLTELYPDYNFVPVYWMASEDHDLDEIRTFSLFGKTYQWETDQTGPVGKMDPGSLSSILEQLPERVEVFERAYLGNKTLSDAVRQYINDLFGEYGLVCIDADCPGLKKQFKEVIKDDILNHMANDIVESDSSKLVNSGYNTQVFPRAINFFYIDGQTRNRIIREKGKYRVIDTDIEFSETEMLQMIEDHPQKFSPNVILRPLYQEIILPNIAYIGGPAEVSYWLQLKGVFEHYKVQFPAIMPRNFALIVGKAIQKKMEKVNLKASHLFRDIHFLKTEYLKSQAEYSFTLETESRILDEIFQSISHKAKAVDPTLDGFVGSEKAKAIKSLENIEKRLKRSEEQKQETGIKQLEGIIDKLFPGGALQERTDNFLNFYLNDDEFIQKLVEFFDPFDFRFNIILQD